MDEMLFINCEKHTKKLRETNSQEIKKKIDRNSNSCKNLDDNLNKEKVSISSIETICSYMCNQKKCDTDNLNNEKNIDDMSILKNEKYISDNINNQKKIDDMNIEKNGNDKNKEENKNNLNNEENTSGISNILGVQTTKDMNKEKCVNEEDNTVRENREHILKNEKYNESNGNEIFIVNAEINSGNSKSNIIHYNDKKCAYVEYSNSNNYIKKKNKYTGNTGIIDDDKKIIIKNMEQINNKNNDNFNYLRDILEQKYKECIYFDGSEYIYIYDICKKNENIENEDIEFNAITTNDKKEDIIILNVYDIYLNFFNKISMKINKIKRLFSTIKIKEIKSTISDSTLSLSNEITNIINNKKVKINNFLKKESEKNPLSKNKNNSVDTNFGAFHSLFNDKKKINIFHKTKFIDKLDFIFLSIFKNTKENNLIKELRNKYNFDEIRLQEIKNNMKKNINRRFLGVDIDDIKIIKRGYTYIFIKEDEWKYFFCVLFYMKNNAIYKNDIIFKHYCKIYDRNYFNNFMKSSNCNSNYFLAFFEDTYFNEDEKSNVEISKLIRKNSYEFILEISKNKQSDIIHNFHSIYVGNHKKTNDYLKIYDISYNPYYLIPFELLLKGEGNNKNVNFLSQIHFNYRILKEWNDSIHTTKEKVEHINNNICTIKEKNEQFHYVNKKINQWIKLFKQERNIKSRTKVVNKNV